MDLSTKPKEQGPTHPSFTAPPKCYSYSYETDKKSAARQIVELLQLRHFLSAKTPEICRQKFNGKIPPIP